MSDKHQCSKCSAELERLYWCPCCDEALSRLSALEAPVGDELTALEAVKLLADKAQWCREEGESDMRYIVHMAARLSEQISSEMSRLDILKYWEDTDD